VGGEINIMRGYLKELGFAITGVMTRFDKSDTPPGERIVKLIAFQEN
jgi:hypothetical protein